MTERYSSGSPYEGDIGFCRALRVGSRILVSGTAPLDTLGKTHAPGDPAAQAQRCLEIIVDAVKNLGGLQSDVVRTRIFLTNAQDWDKVGRVHGAFFGTIRPTATCVVVAALLRPDWCVEIEAEATIPGHIRIHPSDLSDRTWVEERCQALFQGSTVVSWGVAHEPALLPGFVARREGERVGFASYNFDEDECELVTLEALPGHTCQGIGTALLNAVEEAAQKAGCKRLWLITTNDNLDALRFFQRRGLGLVAVHPRALEKSRLIKPSIAEIGYYKIPLRDELILSKAI